MRETGIYRIYRDMRDAIKECFEIDFFEIYQIRHLVLSILDFVCARVITFLQVSNMYEKSLKEKERIVNQNERVKNDI